MSESLKPSMVVTQSEFSSITMVEPPPQAVVTFRDAAGGPQQVTVTGLTGPEIAALSWSDVKDAVVKVLGIIFGGGGGENPEGGGKNVTIKIGDVKGDNNNITIIF